MEHDKSNSKWEVHTDSSLTQKTRKMSNKQSNFMPRGVGKRLTNKTQS